MNTVLQDARSPLVLIPFIICIKTISNTVSFSWPVAGLAGEVAAGSEYLAHAMQALQLEAISTAGAIQFGCMLVTWNTHSVFSCYKVKLSVNLTRWSRI